MEPESVVYGCIKDLKDDQCELYRRDANRLAMLGLPRAEEWPHLCQEMFSIPQNETGVGDYQTHVMHFGASYKAIEYEWKQWIKKFEDLLNSMYWVSAVVHLETELTGIHTFTWESYNDSHTPGTGIQQVKCEWTQEQSFF